MNGRPIVVKELKGNEKLGSFHILFISASERARLGEILRQLGDASVLTVSEVSGFANRGGMINLVATKNRVKIEINRNAAEQANLSISPQLLKLATIVKG